MPTPPTPPARRHTKAAAIACALWPGGWAACLCIVFGVVMTVGSAWVIAARDEFGLDWSGRLAVTVRHQERMDDSWTRLRRVDVVPWPIAVPDAWPDPDFRWDHSGLGFHETYVLTRGTVLSTQPSAQRGRPQRPQEAWEQIEVHRGGLPLPSLSTNDVYDSSWHTGLVIRGVALPIKPIFPAFLLDIAFWTAIPWLGVLAIRHACAARRARQGRCGNCRYPTLGLPRCPECGTPVPDSKLDLVDDGA